MRRTSRGRRRARGSLVLLGWLAIAAAAAAVAACGGEADEPPPGYVPGRWRTFRTHRYDRDLDPEQRQLIEQLESIGYVAGRAPAPNAAGVVNHDRERAFAGANLYASGHGPEAILIDMDGNELHRWRRDFWSIWPDYPVDRWHFDTAYWRRVHLFANGDLLAIFEGLGLLKLDRDSNLIWASTLRAHHDLEVSETGDIYVLTREAHLVPEVDPERPILEDFVSVLDADGREQRRVSLLDAVRNSEYRQLLSESAELDVFHTNSLRVLDGSLAERIPAFRAGTVLVSLLVPDALAVVDLDAARVVWAAQGRWRKQHDPEPLDNGNLLLFDNGGDSGRSAVLEIDPVRGSVTWEYAGSDERPFYSETCGTAQRLPNGNTLVTESDNGRAFEVTPAGGIVWEFYNPHHAGPYIATLFELRRLPPRFPLHWTHAARAP